MIYLTQAEENALAVCINLTDELYKKLEHYPRCVEYREHFQVALSRLETLYSEIVAAFVGERLPLVEVDNNYKYARIIKNGLLIMGQACFFSTEQTTVFIKTIDSILKLGAIVASLSWQTHPTHCHYFSYQYDTLQRLVGEVSFYLKVGEGRSGSSNNFVKTGI